MQPFAMIITKLKYDADPRLVQLGLTEASQKGNRVYLASKYCNQSVE